MWIRNSPAVWTILCSTLTWPAVSAAAEPAQAPPILPVPKKLVLQGGVLRLAANARIVFDRAELAPLAKILAGDIARTHRVTLAVAKAPHAKAGEIEIRLVADDPALGGPDPYRLEVGQRAVLEAGSYDAAAMGAMTLLQALRRDADGTLSVPQMLIEDRADRPFRAVQACIKVGYHDPAWVKRLIDLARFYKIRHVMLHTSEAMWIGCTLESSNTVPAAIRRKHLLWTKREMDDAIAYAKARGVWMFPHNETTPGFVGMTKALTTDFNPTDRFAGYMDEVDGQGPYKVDKRIPDQADPRFWNFIKVVTQRSYDQFAAGWPDGKLGYYHMGPVRGEGGTSPANAVRILGYLRQRNPDIKLIYWNGPPASDKDLAPHKGNLLVTFYSRDWGGTPQSLLTAGYELVNASWSPLYILPNYQRSPREIFEDFHVRRFGSGPFRAGGYENVHWDYIAEGALARRVVGAMLPTWEFAHQDGHLELIADRLPCFAERVWNVTAWPYEKHAWDAMADRIRRLAPTARQFIRLPRPPSVPAGVSATAGVWPGRVELAWASSDNYPDGYRVYRSEGKDSASARLLADHVVGTSYVDRGVRKGIRYQYWVRSVNPYGASEPGGPATGYTGSEVVLAHAWEPFAYAAGELPMDKAGGPGWAGAWEVDSANGPLRMQSEGLTYPGLKTAGGCLRLAPTDADQTNHRRPPSLVLVRPMKGKFGLPATQTWSSFLLRARKVGVGDIRMRLGRRNVAPGKRWGPNLSVYLADAAVACQKDKTYFLVTRFTFRGGRDRVCMWINPTPGTQPTDEQAAVDTEQYQVSPGQEVSLFVQPYGLGVYDVDELRVGPTYASVAPAGKADADAPPVVAVAKKPVPLGLEALAGPKTPLKSHMAISFFGDSITWQGGYIQVLQKALARSTHTRDLQVRLIKRGINGGKSTDLRDGCVKLYGCTQAPFAQVLETDKPAVAVIYIGINDVWHGKKGNDPRTFRACLETLVAQAKAAGVIPVLATLTTIGEKPDGSNPHDKKLDEYAQITREVAARTKTVLVDLRKVFLAYLKTHNPRQADGTYKRKGVLTYDGVHMLPPGNAILADHLGRGIAAALRRDRK